MTVDKTDWGTSPARHEGGSPNVLGAAALAAACQQIASLGDIALDHERGLTDRLRDGLSGIDGVEILRLFNDSTDTVGVLSFVVAGVRAEDVARHLSTEHGIGVRDGRFCAHPLLQRLGHSTGAVRASLGLGTTSEDIDLLVSALERWV